MIEVYIGDKENWAYVEAGSAWCQVAMGECAIGMWTNKEGKPKIILLHEKAIETWSKPKEHKP